MSYQFAGVGFGLASCSACLVEYANLILATAEVAEPLVGVVGLEAAFGNYRIGACRGPCWWVGNY